MFIYNTFHFQSEQFGGGAEATEVGGETEANSMEVGLRRILNTSDVIWGDHFITQKDNNQIFNASEEDVWEIEGDLNEIEGLGVDDVNEGMIEGETEFSLNLSTFVDENYLSWGGDCDFNSQLFNFSGEDVGEVDDVDEIVIKGDEAGSTIGSEIDAMCSDWPDVGVTLSFLDELVVNELGEARVVDVIVIEGDEEFDDMYTDWPDLWVDLQYLDMLGV